MNALCISDLDQTGLETKKAGYELWKFLLHEFRIDNPFQDEDEFARTALLPWPCFLQVCGLHVEISNDINTLAAQHIERFYLEFATWFTPVLETYLEIREDPNLLLAFSTNNVAPAFQSLLKQQGLDTVPLHDSLLTHPHRYKPAPDMIVDHIPKFGEVQVVVVLGDSRSDLSSAIAANEQVDIPVHGSWAQYGSLRRPLDVHGLHDEEFRMRSATDVRKLPQMLRDRLV